MAMVQLHVEAALQRRREELAATARERAARAGQPARPNSWLRAPARIAGSTCIRLGVWLLRYSQRDATTTAAYTVVARAHRLN
jgi:hypothetical protein